MFPSDGINGILCMFRSGTTTAMEANICFSVDTDG